MTARITFDKDYQIWAAAAIDDSRPTLTGVLVDPAGYLVAANGFMLAVVPCRLEDCPQAIIIPARALRNASETAKGTEVTVEVADDHVQVDYPDGVRTSYPVLKGSFPTWRKYLPNVEVLTGHHRVHLNSQFLKDLDLALGRPASPILVNREVSGPHLVIGEGGSFGVLMPMFSEEGADAPTIAAINALREQVAKGE